MRSTLPTRTPASLTSDPSRNPFASPNRAFRCSLRANGLMSPDAFRIRKIKTAIEARTSIPTRSSLRPTVVLVLGMALTSNLRTMDDGRSYHGEQIATLRTVDRLSSIVHGPNRQLAIENRQYPQCPRRNL